MEIASAADLARRWGVSRQRVSRLIREDGFPAPVAEVSGHPVWATREADEWREKRREEKKR